MVRHEFGLRAARRAVAVVLTGVGIAGLGAPVATAASGAADPRVVVGPSQTVLGRPTTVTVDGLSSRARVRVTFGDAAPKALPLTCTPGRGVRARPVCSGSLRYTFADQGMAQVRVFVRGREVYADRVQVAAQQMPTRWPERMLRLVNRARAEAGVAALRLCPALNAAATAHAKDMLARGYYDHASPEGTQPWDRGAAHGYGSNVWFGENIHTHVLSFEAVNRGWVTSPGHYANIVNPNFTDFGFGYAGSADDRRWVENFGAGGMCG